MMLTKTELARVTWQCVHFLSESDRQVLDSDMGDSGLVVRTVSAANIRNEKDLFECLCKAFNFPDYFGYNWDALEECLADLSWLPNKGYVLVVDDGDKLWGESTKVAGQFIESWLATAEQWAEEDIPFHLVILVP